MASLEEDVCDEAKALNWWQRAHDILQGMVERGLHVSPEDHGYLQQIKIKLSKESA